MVKLLVFLFVLGVVYTAVGVVFEAVDRGKRGDTITFNKLEDWKAFLTWPAKLLK